MLGEGKSCGPIVKTLLPLAVDIRLQPTVFMVVYGTARGALAKLRKATVSFKSVCMERLGSHWVAFLEQIFEDFFLQICQGSSVSIKI